MNNKIRESAEAEKLLQSVKNDIEKLTLKMSSHNYFANLGLMKKKKKNRRLINKIIFFLGEATVTEDYLNLSKKEEATGE